MASSSQFHGGSNSRPSSKDGPKKNIWSSMLDSVANGKRLPEKNLLILGSSRPLSVDFGNMSVSMRFFSVA